MTEPSSWEMWSTKQEKRVDRTMTVLPFSASKSIADKLQYTSANLFATFTVTSQYVPLKSLLYKTSSRGLVGLVATKSHACYLLAGTGWDWVRILLGLNFSGSVCGVSGHA